MDDVPTGCIGKLFTKAVSKNYYQKKQENKTVVSNLANNVR